ncbi:hypothetical protein NGRA_2918 [Nosema granulosis]|uniref:Uncharacterized protein n=1 Tax=Nosema granulosis TaxID=83296 RepID=A0A9P6KXZ9_9MICR|nr:hypothetical protein NGRA_2918 [Nosema granulosis]
MDLSECTIENDKELLNHSIKKSIRNIQTTVKEFEKNSVECLLCQRDFKIHNIHDLVRIYSLVMHCLTYHCTTVERLNEEDIFVVELFLLKFVMKSEPNDIRAIILYSNNSNERLYKESLSAQLTALFQTHYADKRIAFNCEQDIESLLYKYYKKLEELKRTEIMSKAEYLLLVLYVRREYERFQRLYGRVKKDNFMYKLGLMMNIVDENTPEVLRLCEEYDKYVGEKIEHEKNNTVNNTHKNTENNTHKNTVNNTHKNTENNTHKNTVNNTHKNTVNNTHKNTVNNTHKNTENNTHKNTEELETFLRYIDKKYRLELGEMFDFFERSPSIKLWVSEKTNLNHWEECVKMWSKNRSGRSNYVDNSMIDLCVKYMKFEEGWLIYNNSFGANTSGFSRAIRLCATALRISKNTKWRNRLLEVISDIFEHIENINTIVILENLFVDIEKLTVASFVKVVSELQERLIKAKIDDETVDTILRLYYNASATNGDVAKKLCRYSMDFYSKWSKSKKRFCFFTRKTEYDTKIYSSLLGICDNAKDCEAFYRVCRAILRNETSINREMCRRLENFHTRNCKNCIYKHQQVVTVKESRGFIFHLFE